MVGRNSTDDDRFSMHWSNPAGPDVPVEICRTHTAEANVGHFAICSFDFFALAEWQPLETGHGVRIARREMMALANLPHRPEIADSLLPAPTTSDSTRNSAESWSWLP